MYCEKNCFSTFELYFGLFVIYAEVKNLAYLRFDFNGLVDFVIIL